MKRVLAGMVLFALDAGLDAAKANGWTLVSMKHDWKTIFPAE